MCGVNIVGALRWRRQSGSWCTAVKPSPSIKLATNSDMYRHQSEDMDINCGDILDGVTIEEKGREILDKVIAVASGEKSKSEEFGYGDNEFVPWQIGAVM